MTREAGQGTGQECGDMQNELCICLYCFQVCEDPDGCHASPVLECKPGQPGSLRRKPVMDRSGRILSRAPRWFLEATGWINALAPYTVWRDL
jgi:hypothetical protein